MANRVNNWKQLLKVANEDLAKKGLAIKCEKDVEGSYTIKVTMPTGKDEIYGETLYEDELSDAINEALSWANKMSVLEKVIVLTALDSDYEQHILCVYRGKNLGDVKGENFVPALRAFAADDMNGEEFESEDDLKATAEMLATKTLVESECGITYELHYVNLVNIVELISF